LITVPVPLITFFSLAFLFVIPATFLSPFFPFDITEEITMSLLHLHSQNTSTASIPHVHTDHEVEHAFARGKHQEKEPQTMEELLNRLMEGGDDE